jgi:hypothetical protein
MSAAYVGVRVASLNISWEANNAHKSPGGRWTTDDKEIPTKHKSWEAAKKAWKNQSRYKSLGKAYRQSLKVIAQQTPDVILLQEFQDYGTSVDDAIECLNQYSQLTYLLAAKQSHELQSKKGLVCANTACIVLVSAKRFAISLPDALLYKQIPAGSNLKHAFKKGRPLAGAICQDLSDGRQYLIVSSHSAHYQDWNKKSFSVAALKDLFDSVSLYNIPNLSLIWGGDFNKEISIGSDGFFGTKQVYKLPNIPGPYHKYWTGKYHDYDEKKGYNYYGKTKVRKAVDWILATSVTDTSPEAIGHLEGHTNSNVLQGSASDHRPTLIRTTCSFKDMTLI